MNEKALKTLEFDKIISQLESFAASPPGRDLCRGLIPFSDIEQVRQAQAETTDALARVRQKGSVSFSGVKEIEDSLKRLEIGGSLSAAELLAVSSLLTAAARVRAYGRREEAEEQTEDSLEGLFRMLEPLAPLNQEIKRCILSEEEISDDASPGLRHVRRSINVLHDRVHSQLNAVLNSSRACLQEAVITMRDGRYCLPVKAEYKNQVPGMIHDQSSTGSTVFIEPMAVIRLNNELRELEIQEKKEIDAVLADLSNQAAPHIEAIRTDREVLARLDFIFAKAALSRHYRGSEPLFNTDGYLNIKEGRHPLLDARNVVPINLSLGRDFDLLIVTGPNTGGKTVSLKTVGLFTLMGQAGLHIPAFEGSELAVFHEVFADIGDEQSIEQSLSTFSAHMTNIVSILRQADSRSLCLFDELGAGTDPTEGAALAISILNFLHNMGCRAMATTHYSELKVYALTTAGVENACCEFNVESLRPTYRLLIGIPGKSNAFAISKKLGLPDDLIEDARSRLKTNDKAFEDLLAHLEESRVTIEKEQEELQASREEAARLRERLSRKEERLEETREKTLRDAREEARKILLEAKETADRTIRNINRIAASSGAGAAVSKELEGERAGLREQMNRIDEKLTVKTKDSPKTVSPDHIRVGDGVRVLSLNLDGIVSSLPNAKGDLYVQMGILRSLVNVKDLELLDEPAVSGPGLPGSGRNSVPGQKSAPGQKNSFGKNGSGKTPGTGQKTGAGQIRMSKSFSVSPEINLIGMTTDEAIPALDKYLDDAYLSHIPQVRVIHGRGTGALRAAVHKRLKKLNYVKEFRLGEFGEGDSGVTIVTFR